jgi:drug/metabolite transporter (DMT)-like permease
MAKMTARDFTILLLTAAMWGASFMFMRVIAPVTGWVWAADLRVLIGGALISAMLIWQGQAWNLARDYRHYLVLGLINSAIPFSLFALAALHIPAAYSALGNATAPMWSAVLSAAILGERLTWPKSTGLVLGLVGVALTAGAGGVSLTTAVLMAVMATIVASVLYALAGVYMRTQAAHIQPLALGAGSQLAAALWLAPLMPFKLPSTAIFSPKILFCLLCSGVLCTGLPYFLYFPLMRRIGVTRALTVTFLVPCFAVLWAFLFLHEAISLSTVAGCALVFSGLVLVVRK